MAKGHELRRRPAVLGSANLNQLGGLSDAAMAFHHHFDSRSPRG
jgi:hypothetical protein